jgi:Anthrone oxygenase
MSAGWAIPMLVGGGLFAGGVVSIAWERIPTWRATDLPDFQTAFAHTLRRVDRLQPALLAVCLISTTGFALSEGGAARIFAVLAAAGFLIVLLVSAAWLVPIQRRLVASGTERPSAELEKLRAQWLRGHLIRTFVALASLTFAVVAAAS